MTLTKAVQYKKHVEPSLIQQPLFPFLFFPSSNRGVQENQRSPQPLLTAKAASFSHPHVAAGCLPNAGQRSSGPGQSEGLQCGGGELSKQDEGRQISIQGPEALSKVSSRDAAPCSCYAITSKVCTAPRVLQPARKSRIGRSRAAGRRCINDFNCSSKMLKGR